MVLMDDAREPNAVDLILWHLSKLQPGLEKSLVLTEPPEKNGFRAVLLTGDLYWYCRDHRWTVDQHVIASVFHGGNLNSFRETGGVKAALQVVFYFIGLENVWKPEYAGLPIYVWIDHDYRNPEGGIWSFLGHVAEVIWNTVTGGKTSQRKIKAMLEERYGPMGAENG